MAVESAGATLFEVWLKTAAGTRRRSFAGHCGQGLGELYWASFRARAQAPGFAVIVAVSRLQMCRDQCHPRAPLCPLARW